VSNYLYQYYKEFQPYTELHLHTDYSLLDGLNTSREYAARAVELGMTHLPITDHGTVAGWRDHQIACREYGLKPILGCEMYISATGRDDRRSVKKRDDNTQAYNHIIVLAKDEIGYRNLNILSERAWTEGFYSKPRIDMEILEEHQEGLIVLSGCLNGLIAKAIANGKPVEANNYVTEFKRIFGERFFIEVQGHNPREINEGLLDLADKHEVLAVLTSDCHHAREEDKWLEDAMLILSTGPKQAKGFDYATAKQELEKEAKEFGYDEETKYLRRLDQAYPDRTMAYADFGLFLHDAEAHQHAHWPAPGSGDKPWDHSRIDKAIDNTMVVAGMIGDYPFYENLDLLPRPTNGNAHDILRRKVIEGARKRGTYGKPEYDARREEELTIIGDKGFDAYFLIEAGEVQWGRNQGIMFGPGRGSGAGSLVNYELFITEVDPLPHNLLFFRFINPERNDYPDIDTDVEITRRSEIKAHAARKYKNVASIATYGTFAGKNSVRDAARVFLVPLGDVNKALKGADWQPPLDWWYEWERTDKAHTFIKKYPEVIRLAKFLYGRRRTQGMHAGGLVVSREPISNYAPMQTAKDNSDEAGARIPLVAYDMETAADIGFIKYDFLGLKALTIISQTLKMIKGRTGKDIVLTDLDLDDKRIYKNLSQGFTRAVFQCEATPYTNLLIKMGGVKGFDDLVASNALVRPGAMNSSAGAAFIARNKGEEMVEYHHPDMVDFTRDTNGVVIYQEQVMLTMTELAGMKMSTADKVRKIIGKKRDVSEFEQYKAEFIEGASKKVKKKKAEQLWHDFEAHAGYSFNKSHAVAYSMLSYWTAWLKEYYPLEFMTAVLRNENDKDSLLDYLMETKRMGIKVMLPHVNVSGEKFEIQGEPGKEYIRFGLSNIKYLSGKTAYSLLDKRPFASYNELYETVMTKGSGLSTRVLQALNAVGAATFEDHPRTGNERDNFFEYLNIPAFQTKDLSPVVKAQFRPLDEFSPDETFVSMGMVRGIKTGPGWARIDIVDETASAGVFTGEHTQIETGQMYVFLISNNRVSRYVTVEDLTNDKGEDFQEFLEATSFPDVPEGMLRVVSFNSRTTKAGNRMADAVFCDEHKNLQAAMAFPQQFMKAFVTCQPGAVVDVQLGRTKDSAVYIENIL
jgi:DNA polymerase-3 subunit alpha